MFSLADRMKRYESVFSDTLLRRTPVIIRVDGKAFHTLTRGMDRPWDQRFIECMEKAALGLMKEIQGAQLAYVQSDEISVLVTDYATIQTDAWFGYKVQKVASISASVATAYFTDAFRLRFNHDKAHTIPLFDSRAFNLPKDEVANYFVWRQRDAVRNSINGLAQTKFSQNQLHKKNTDQVQDMLYVEHNINWNNELTYHKRGFCVVRDTGGTIRTDWNIPEFTKDREYIEVLL